jgi:alpha-ribazole phosphatase/probable phosphoglycerate mutase
MTPEGIRQMGRLRDMLRGRDIECLYSSDLTRSKKGAEIIGEGISLRPLVCEELREINIGAWEGLTTKKIMAQCPEDFARRLEDLVGFRVPGGESFRDLERRVMGKVRDMLSAGNGKTVALVAHGGVNRVILCHALKLDLHRLLSIEQDYGCLNIIDYYDDVSVVKLMNGGISEYM